LASLGYKSQISDLLKCIVNELTTNSRDTSNPCGVGRVMGRLTGTAGRKCANWATLGFHGSLLGRQDRGQSSRM
jgi:hypothetical protein